MPGPRSTDLLRRSFQYGRKRSPTPLRYAKLRVFFYDFEKHDETLRIISFFENLGYEFPCDECFFYSSTGESDAFDLIIGSNAEIKIAKYVLLVFYSILCLLTL